MGYTTGQAITLSRVPLYSVSYADYKIDTISGTYYVWSGVEICGRIRITTDVSYAGKIPISKYAIGWINTSNISGSSGTSATSDSGKASSAYGSSTVSSSNSSAVTPSIEVPGEIGYLGTVIFLVTASQIKTIESFTWSHSANYAEHQRHLQRPALEFTGCGPDEISFTFTLSAYLGTEPMTDYSTLLGYMRKGTAIPLRLGSKLYGYYRWVITALSYTGVYSDRDGDWTQATVKVSLTGYEKDLSTT